MGARGGREAIRAATYRREFILGCVRTDGVEVTYNAGKNTESQERMAVVVAAKDAERFIEEATKENLEAYVVAKVTDKARMTMTLNGQIIADLSREFLDTNGATKHMSATVNKLKDYKNTGFYGTAIDQLGRAHV